jgi:hypothetical protein
MRAILIDPFTRTVTEIDIDPSLDNLYSTLHVDMITVVRWDETHALILDDEGLLKSKDEMEYWWANGSGQPFAGRGLILGDDYGENRAATLTVQSVEERMRFVPKDMINPDEWTGWTITTF